MCTYQQAGLVFGFVDDFVGLVLLDSARELPGGARSLVQQFMNQGKSVMALARSVGLLAEVTEAEIAEHSDVAMAINGTVYASSGRESSAQAVEIFADQLAA